LKFLYIILFLNFILFNKYIFSEEEKNYDLNDYSNAIELFLKSPGYVEETPQKFPEIKKEDKKKDTKYGNYNFNPLKQEKKEYEIKKVDTQEKKEFKTVSYKIQKPEDFTSKNPYTEAEIGETLTIIIAIDRSGSLKGYDNLLKQITESTLDQLKLEDSSAIIGFDKKIEIIQNFTKNRWLLKKAVSKYYFKGETPLYDTIVEATKKFDEIPGKKKLIIISDGIDANLNDTAPGSNHTISQAIRYSLKNKIPVFFTGIGKKIDTNTIKKISKETEGDFAIINNLQEASSKDFRKQVYDFLYPKPKRSGLFTYFNTDLNYNRVPGYTILSGNFNGLTGLINTSSAYVLKKNSFIVGSGFKFHNIINDTKGNLVHIENNESNLIWSAPIYSIFGILDNLELGVVLPFSGWNINAKTLLVDLNGNNYAPEKTETVGDMEFKFKYKLPIDSKLTDFAIGMGLKFPTGKKNSQFGSSGKLDFELFSAISHRFGILTGHTNLGYIFTGDNHNVPIGIDDDIIYANFGVDYTKTKNISVSLEFNLENMGDFGGKVDFTLGVRTNIKDKATFIVGMPISLVNNQKYGYDYQLVTALDFKF
jgi:Mg-chelatase subunit ChlD